MCRWGCAGVSSTFMCKWCGTRYCRDCLHGEFNGLMRESAICAKCNQKNCQGVKVEAILKQYVTDENAKGGKSGSGTGARSRSASPSKKGKTGGSGKKSGGKKSGGKKGGKKKKKK